MIERHAAYHFGSVSFTTAVCIVVVQATMVPVAVLVGRTAGEWPRKPLFLVALAAAWPSRSNLKRR